MRTTIDIPEHLLREAKAAASLAGQSLKTFVTDALAARVATAERRIGRSRIQLPLVRSKAPGSLDLSSDRVAEILATEDIRALAGH